MRKTKISADLIISKTNELKQKESIINLNIIQEEIGIFEHHEYALRFLKLLKKFIEICDQKANIKTPIKEEEFYEWLKKEKYII